MFDNIVQRFLGDAIEGDMYCFRQRLHILEVELKLQPGPARNRFGQL